MRVPFQKECYAKEELLAGLGLVLPKNRLRDRRGARCVLTFVPVWNTYLKKSELEWDMISISGCFERRAAMRNRVPAKRFGWATCLPLLGALAVITGCVTTSADFRLSKIGPDEAAIAGRLTIIYNGKAFTEHCRATFGGSVIKLSDDGVVLFRVKKGWTQLERLDCQDGSNQHVQIKGAGFFAQGDGWVSDFGDVAIMWQTTGGFKVSSMFGLIGAVIDEASDDGTADVEISSPAAEVREAFRRQTGVDGRWVVQQLTRPSR